MAEKKSITRRDFLNGAAISLASVGIGGDGLALAAVDGEAPFASGSSAASTDYYPPGLTGLRGNHPGSNDYAHPLAWNDEAPADFSDTNEEYDLVVVGGGLSGLAAALFYQKERGRDQRILILDNHDDFGGHARRNEFNVNGQMLLGVGGSINLEFPDDYSKEVKGLLKDVGIHFKRLEASNDPNYSLGGAITSDISYFAKAADGKTGEVVGRWMSAMHGKADPKPLISQLPYSQDDKDKLLTLFRGKWDYLVGLSIEDRAAYQSSHSYHGFLRDKVGLSDDAVTIFDPIIRSGYGVGGDGVSVSEALKSGAPGLRSVGWPWAWADRLLYKEDAYHALVFPDGNASVARLMVRKLIPEVAPGESMDDIAAARFDYGKLDVPGAPVRLRLNSTAVRVREDDGRVHVSYVEKGAAKRVTANHCVLACYNAIIPHMCPDMSEEQKQGLSYGSKVPFIWANVAIREGTPFYKASSEAFFCPNSYFHFVTKAPPVKLDDFQTPEKPTDPLVLFMFNSPTPLRQDGTSNRDLYRMARYQLLQTPFSTFEEEVKAQLNEMYGAYGFDADRDIEAITINRWAHGYAYTYCELDDPKFAKGQHPHEIGRKQFGRISIANTDAEAKPYLNGAIDAAWRAVREQTSLAVRG